MAYAYNTCHRGCAEPEYPEGYAGPYSGPEYSGNPYGPEPYPPGYAGHPDAQWGPYGHMVPSPRH